MADASRQTVEDYRAACPHCGADRSQEHSCPACGKIQPTTAGTDYFSFFGLPRRLSIDESELEKSFYSLSRRFHPDYFMTATEAERQASTELSSMLNDAYRTLRNRVARAQYLLSLEGYKEAEKKAPPDLLEEVFELNMQIEELKAAKKMSDETEVAEARASLEAALSGLRDRLTGLDERLVRLFHEWDFALDRAAEAAEKKLVLDRMSKLLSHRSYIRNLIRDIKEEI